VHALKRRPSGNCEKINLVKKVGSKGNGADGYIICNHDRVVVAFRGTETNGESAQEALQKDPLNILFISAT